MRQAAYWEEAHYMQKSEKKKSAFFRFLNPLDADFTPKLNLHNGRPAHTNYNP